MVGSLVRLLALAVMASAADAAPQPGGSPAVTTQPGIELPILGLAQVSIRVSDLARSRRFYHDVLGFPEAFDLKDAAGKVTSAFFKVNDDQYIVLLPMAGPLPLVREAGFTIEASDLDKLRAFYEQRGLAPSPITTGADGNPFFRLIAPNGFPFDFLHYAPDSRQGRLRGKLLVPARLSTHLLHAAAMAKDDATKAFFQQLGWQRTLPGPRGDYIETPSSDRNLETKNPPLDPNDPATLAAYTRELYGAVYHFSLEIGDMHAARELLKRRGGYDDVRLRVASGNNRHWLLHLFDPDGTRAELMSRDPVPDGVTPFSVMPPGPPGPPILATKPGVYPWP